MRIITALVFLLVCICVTECFVKFNFQRRRTLRSMGFLKKSLKNIMCRLRHYKSVINADNKMVSCQRTCPKFHEENISLRWGHYCKPTVSPCMIPHCKKCDDRNMFCRQCDRGLVPSEVNRQGHNHCYKKCPNGTKLHLINGIVICAQESTTTVSTTTKTVESYPLTTKAPVLDKGCADKHCVTCQPGYYQYILMQSVKLCLKECPQGHTIVEDRCLPCADRRCASCNDSIVECKKCMPGYYMLLDATNILQECVRKCPEGYNNRIIDNARVCVEVKENKTECAVNNCTRCISRKLHDYHQGCAECESGLVLFRGSFRDHCYDNCPPTYFENKQSGRNISVCTRCKTSFCKSCPDGVSCNECIEPLILDSRTKKCRLCPMHKEYHFELRKCVPAQIDNQPELGNPFSNNVFAG